MLEDNPATVPTLFAGIDFANDKSKQAEVWVLDDGMNLTLHFEAPGPRLKVRLTAVDCPFGTSLGFEAALRGERLADQHSDGHKTRRTDQLLRARVEASLERAYGRAGGFAVG